MEDNYFKNDEYWREHINKKLEEDIWIKDYKEYFLGKGKCLDLGCGIGQYSKELINYGYEVTSADISDIALEKVKEFNSNVIKIDMKENLPFTDNTFDVVFANLSIHYFSDEDTKKIMKEIKRILKKDGLFIGSVNGIQGYEKIKETAIELEKHYWFNKNKYIRLFDKEDLKNANSPSENRKVINAVGITYESSDNSPAGIILTPDRDTVFIGDQVQITPTVHDINMRPVAGNAILSSNQGTINGNTFTPNTGGNVQVNASCQNASGSLNIFVIDKVTGIEVLI